MLDDYSAPVDEDINPHNREPEDLLLEDDTGDDAGISLYKDTDSVEEEDEEETFFTSNFLEQQYGGEIPF